MAAAAAGAATDGGDDGGGQQLLRAEGLDIEYQEMASVLNAGPLDGGFDMEAALAELMAIGAPPTS